MSINISTMAVEKSYFYAQEEAPLCILSSPFVSLPLRCSFLSTFIFHAFYVCFSRHHCLLNSLFLPSPPLATHRRGYVYWRLLSSDPEAARAVVLSEKPEVRVGRHLLEQCNTE